MDWFQPISQPIFMPPAIQFGAEIQPIIFIPPAVTVSDSVIVLIDLVDENLR